MLTSNSKLLAKWQEPYLVMAWKGQVTFEVNMGERRKHCRIHVNMLQHEKGETSLWVEEEKENEMEESEIII